jgi:ABC-2 type transport system permease protein
MIQTWRSFAALFKIYLQEGLVYPAQGIIWILTDGITTMTMPLVMALAAGRGQINGYMAGDFVVYYLAVLVIGCFVTCHFMWEIGWEIKEGIFSAHLIRPVSYFQFIFARNFAWRIIRVVLAAPVVGLLVFAYRGYIGEVNLYFGWELWVAIFLGHLVSLCFVMALSMIALFVQDASSIFEIHYFPMLFLSGQMFPIDVMPQWVKSISYFMPFYYTTALPTEILLSKTTGSQALVLIGGQVVCYGLFRLLFRKGTQHYSGVGM